MTYVPDNIKNLGKQCGVIFYVPAAFTSKIDPSTGFISAFNFKSISTNASRKQFFMQFDEIRYCAEKDMFSFGFDYNNFIVSVRFIDFVLPVLLALLNSLHNCYLYINLQFR